MGDVDGAGLESVPISALEHWSYCPRQCGLIHLEQTFDENYYTIKGSLVHERTDAGEASLERGIRTFRAVPLWNDRLGLIGKADVVEMRGDVPYPVEFKSGEMRDWAHEAVQLCAQAMCLEEMLGQPVPTGAISYLASRHRREVAFDPALRQQVVEATEAVREMLRTERLPAAVDDARCRRCSLLDSCLPRVVAKPRRLEQLAAALFIADDVGDA